MLRQYAGRGFRAALANQAQLPASLGGAATHELSGQGCLGVEPAVSLPRCNDTALSIAAIHSHDQGLRRLPPRPTGRLEIWRNCASATMAAVPPRPAVFFASVTSQETNPAEDSAKKASRRASANAESAAAPKPKTTRSQKVRDNAKARKAVSLAKSKAREKALVEKLKAQGKTRVAEALARAAKAQVKAVAEVKAKANEKLKAALEKAKAEAAEKVARVQAKSKAKPKRAPTAQHLYIREQCKANPRLSLAEASQGFKELPEFAKQKYVDQAAIGKAEAQQERKRLAAERAARCAIPAFMFYLAEQRPAVMAANPGMPLTDAVKRVGGMWRDMSVEQRQKYEDMSDADRTAKGLVRRTPRAAAAATVQPAVQPTAQPAVQPTAQPAAQPTVKPTAQSQQS